MTQWEMRDGTKINIKDMETSHINNCIKMLSRQIEKLEDIGEDFIDASGDTDGTWNLGVWDVKADIYIRQKWIIAFYKELEERYEKREKNIMD